MNTRKYNAARKACNFGGKTFIDIVEVLAKHTALDKLTGRQIGELVNAMYASNLHGQNTILSEFNLLKK